MALAAKTDSLLLVLDQTLAHQATFDRQRLDRLATLSAEFRSAEADENARFHLALLIHQEYKVFKYDSAFAYAQRLELLARQLHSPDKLQLARMKLAFTLRSAGLFKECFDTLQAIQTRQLAARNRAEYDELYSMTYAELADFVVDTQYQQFYIAKSRAYADSAARYYQPGSEAYLALQLFGAKQRGDLPAGQQAYAQLMRLPLAPHPIAIYTSSLSKLYAEAGQRDLAQQLMLQAAIGDLESATKEGIALFRISDFCYQQGDLQRAYYYITEARKMATFFKARQRLVQMSRLTARIDGQKINIVESQRQQAKHYALAIGVLATLLLGFAFIIFAQLRRLRKAGRLLAATNQELHATNQQQQGLNARQQELNQQLQALNQGLNEANHIKEEYIGYYFSNTSRYLDKLEALQKKMITLLTNKQLNAAQQLVKAIDIKAERAELFKGFDTVFIHLFPNFVREFNALFSEPDRIELADDNLLTTELRIFALIRLGVSDSEQISRILGYSIHTVYAYKTRVKNRSFLPNEAFEARVLAIQAA
ncbi:MAG: DUF6377 domain-containing protein [Janthinobacterium lividum]